MQTITSTFDCGGTPTAKATVRQAGESAKDFVDRHESELESAMEGC